MHSCPPECRHRIPVAARLCQPLLKRETVLSSIVSHDLLCTCDLSLPFHRLIAPYSGASERVPQLLEEDELTSLLSKTWTLTTKPWLSAVKSSL